MSMVTNQMFQNTYALNRLNAAYRIQNNNEKLTNTMQKSQTLSPENSLRMEKQITFGSLMDRFLLLFSSKAEENLKVQQKENIRRSFSTFA